jgi:hypothetical protein
MDEALRQAFAWIDELFEELRLPGVSKGIFMRRPSLKHRGRSIIGSKDGRVIVVHCPLELKELLFENEPEIYFQTDHYRGYPALLLRPEKVDKDLLRVRIETAWRMNATKRQIADYEAMGTSDAR